MIGVNASEDTVFCSVEYDLDTFQTEKTGWKQLLRQISPPEGIGIEEGLQAYSYPYYVMDPQKIDLSYFSLCSDGSYFFEWLYEVNDPENFFLEYAVNGGVWNSVRPIVQTTFALFCGTTKCSFWPAASGDPAIPMTIVCVTVGKHPIGWNSP